MVESIINWLIMLQALTSTHVLIMLPFIIYQLVESILPLILPNTLILILLFMFCKNNSYKYVERTCDIQKDFHRKNNKLEINL